jgi:tetratricopeptide (TPR) repeat protein
MSLFTKIFGTTGGADKAAAAPREYDFFTTLSMQLRGELEPALALYQGAAAADPGDSLAPFFAAAIQAGQGDTAAAAESLRSLSERAAAEGESISRKILLELSAEVGDESVPLSPAAVAQLIVAFGDLLKKEGLLRESAVTFEIAAGLAPDNANVLHKLGDTLHDLRVYDYAESVLQGALQCAPNHWGALYSYAVLLQDLGRDEEAIACYQKAVVFHPGHAKCQNNYGAALLRTNRLEEALVHCNLAAGLDPGSPFVKINLGNIHLLMGKYETARKFFAEAIALDNTLAPAYFGLGAVEQGVNGDPGRVRELYLKALEINPAIAEAHQALGNQYALERNPEALSHFAAAAQLNDNLRNLQRDFGFACLQLGRREEAQEHLRLALLQDPDDAALQDALAGLEAEKLAE